jgi:hypothetical protein
MTRWEKLSTVLLRLVDSARQQSGAIAHMTSNFGRMCDTLDRVETRLDETHASHQKAIREYTGLEARVTKLERSGNAAE